MSSIRDQNSPPAVEVKDLVIEFDTPRGRRCVVNGVSFEVRAGQILGILGESGSGKTMSTQAILGLVDGYPGVMGGDITLYDHSQRLAADENLKEAPQDEIVTHHLLDKLPEYLYERSARRSQPLQREKRERAWRRKRAQTMKPLWGRVVTAIFQNPRRSLDPLMTVGAQVLESIKAREMSRVTQAKRAQSGRVTLETPPLKDLASEALQWLERVQMTNPERVFSSYPHELSGGMCQRAMIAVALACKPQLLIADEPTTGLDATVRAQVVDLLKDLITSEQCAMLYITHDIREMLYLADHVIVMRHGEVLERASVSELRDQTSWHHPYTQTLLSAAGLLDDTSPSPSSLNMPLISLEGSSQNTSAPVQGGTADLTGEII